jgi:hypothetical protein
MSPPALGDATQEQAVQASKEVAQVSKALEEVVKALNVLVL